MEDISAIVAKVPVCGATRPDGATADGAFDTLREIFEVEDASRSLDDVAGPMPVVSLDQINAPSLLLPPQAFRWFLEYGARHGRGWENNATRVVPKTPVPSSPFVTAPRLDMPVLMMSGGHIELLWEDIPNLLIAVAAQTEFLFRVL